jgi:hypothetical protein
MAADSINDYLETLGPKENRGSPGDVPPDLSMIIWKASRGPRGPFEIAEFKANANNASFARLTEYLTSHNRKATVSNFFVWKFTDGSGSIGRKVKVKA